MALPVPLRRGAPSSAWPIVLVIVAICSFQLGGTLAKQLFPLVGALGASALRLSLSAVILSGVVRPWRTTLDRTAVPTLVVYGLALAGVNTFFYLALRTVPLGIAVAIDFLGPLAVAVAYSRRLVDGLWVLVAAAGIALLLPIGGGVTALDPVGVGYCLCAAVSWGVYIVAGGRTGRHLTSGRATAIGVAIAALVILPMGLADAGSALLSPTALPLGLLVAVLSSALPNSLEMIAMTRLPPRVFGILMSLEPAVGALFGWLILHEALTSRQLLAILMVVTASGGSSLTGTRPVAVADA